MSHIAIFGFIIALITGSWAGFATWHAYSHHRLPLLRQLLTFVVLFNVLVFMYLVGRYLVVNVLAENFSAGAPIWRVLYYLVGYLAESGVGFTLIQLSYSGRDRILPGLVRRVLIVVISIFGASFVIGSTLAFEGAGIAWLRWSYAVLLTVMTQGAMVFLALLSFGSHPDLSPARRHSARLLGRLLLLGWVIFALVPLVPGPAATVLGALDVVGLNLVPLIWLKYGFERGYTAPLSPTHDAALLVLASRYGLSKREQEVVELILKGKSNREIEELLFISFNTVKNHVYNIFRKLGVSSRGQLTSLFIALQDEMPPDTDASM